MSLVSTRVLLLLLFSSKPFKTLSPSWTLTPCWLSRHWQKPNSSCCGVPKTRTNALRCLEELSRMTALRVFVKSGDSRSHPIEQETQLAHSKVCRVPFYATEYKDYQTRLHATSLQSISHIRNETRGNPHNNLGNPHQTIVLEQMSWKKIMLGQHRT